MENEITAKERKFVKKNRIKELVETYPGLLTERERKILMLYVNPNNNGALIAKNLNISRQAVHDHIRRAVNKMERCDSKAHSVEMRKKIKKLIIELEGIVEAIKAKIQDDNLLKKVQEAQSILKEIDNLT